MIQQGLWEEFQSLLQRGLSRESPGLRCVGYRELFDVEDRAIDLQSAIDRIKQNTRHYAKRQCTWLRHQQGGVEIDMTGDNCLPEIRRLVSAFIHS
jgi:tRNA dimethylallyltransferase